MMAAIATMGTSFLLSNVVQTEAATSETIEEPMTHMQFPLTIHNGTDQKVILGLGSRQVSFLKLNVYVMGMYVSPKDARVLRKAGIWTDAQAAMDSMDQAQQMLKQPIDIAIRIGMLFGLETICAEGSTNFRYCSSYQSNRCATSKGWFYSFPTAAHARPFKGFDRRR
jgi:hypothetical protein